ncbi:MAG TPA: ATP-binding cassette domain-containing protein, partial [Ktedonobacteraceae bacterium]
YGTVRENILLARPSASDAEVMQAAELAGVTAFLDELPRGLDTQVGEQGMQLSAGQAQRVAIARAILKNAPVLILDEPTSSLDPDSEAHIRRSLTALMHERTVLVIAHRYNTIAHASHIVVLENGRIVEAGTREALTASGGAYAHLLGAAGVPANEGYSVIALQSNAGAAFQGQERWP